MFSQCLQSTVLKRETDRCLCSTQPARLPFILPNTPPPFHQRLHSYTTMTVPLISVFLPPDWFKACMMWGGLKERYGTGSDVINSPWISQCHRNRKPFFFFFAGEPTCCHHQRRQHLMACFACVQGYIPHQCRKPLEEKAGLIGKSRTDSACPGYPVQDHRLWICHGIIRLVRYPHRLGCIS